MKNKYNHSVFSDLLKTFEIVNHSIILATEKLNLSGVKRKISQYFKSSLSHRKLCIVSNIESAAYQNIAWRVLQGSILETLLFQIFVNNLDRASARVNPIIKTQLIHIYKYTHIYWIQTSKNLSVLSINKKLLDF